VANDVSPVSERELVAVSGGAVPIVDTTGMPDRSVMCGTMWYQQQLLRLLGIVR
jgi:hypothetical protein